jgi:acetate kinase (EC 2.7.2.1)
MEYMGIKLDVEKNAKIQGEEAVVSAPDSKVIVMVVPTDEEYMIASDTMEIVNK